MADVVVHRLLQCSIDGSEPPYTKDEVAALADRCNERKQAAKVAQEASQKLFMCVYIDMYGPFTEEASVSKVNDRSFEVVVARLGIELRVLLEKVAGLDFDQHRDYDKRNNELSLKWRTAELAISNDGGDAAIDGPPPRLQQVKLFDKVSVVVTAVKDGPKSDVKATLLPPSVQSV